MSYLAASASGTLFAEGLDDATGTANQVIWLVVNTSNTPATTVARCPYEASAVQIADALNTAEEE